MIDVSSFIGLAFAPHSPALPAVAPYLHPAFTGGPGGAALPAAPTQGDGWAKDFAQQDRLADL
jgi:hypothetical protein